MVIIPREKPIIENLNIYYLDVEKLLEHYQGEVGCGGIYFKSHAAEGVIFFDKDDLLNAIYREKDVELTGADAVDQLINAGGQYNFSVHVYQISMDEVYFWSSIPSAEKIYKDLSTEFTDLEGLIRKMSSEKLTGYIDVAIGNGRESGLIFIINGKIMGGSFTWDNGEPGPTRKNQELLIKKTKKLGGSFNVCRIPLSKMKGRGEARRPSGKPSHNTILMMEELLKIFEKTISSRKKMKADFNKILKKKFVENAEKYAFLDPFAAEFEYSNRRIKFSGAATDQELINGVTNSLRQLAQELGMVAQFLANTGVWSEKYAKQLVIFQRKIGVMTNISSISDFGISARGYAEFFDGIPAAIYRTTLEGKIVYCNRAFARLFGFAAAAELIDSPIIELYRHKKDRGLFVHSILQRGRLIDLPVAFKMKNGTTILCAVTAKVVLDDDGMVVHLDGFMRDITDQTHAPKTNARLDGIADDIKDIVIIMDLQGDLIDINRAGQQLTGFSREQMQGQPLSGFFVPEDREFFIIFLSDILKIGRSETVLAVMDHNSQKHHLDWHAYLVRNEGRPHHIKCIVRDVSDIVARQRQRNIDQKFEGVLEMAGGVAHSMNQPLTIVNNLLSELLEQQQPDDTSLPKLLKVRHQIDRMNEIAKKIGNIKKYEAMDYVAGVKIVDIDKASWGRNKDNS